MYTVQNYKSKAALKRDLKNGKQVQVFQPGPFDGTPPQTGKVYLEGPHYPEPHRWYAEAWLEEGLVVKIK